MNKTIKGLIFGAIAGCLDVAPMIFQKLPVEADISAFVMWVVIGYLMVSCDIGIKGIFKGIVLSFLILAPSAVLIGWNNPLNLIPVGIMTLILGAVLGYFLE